MADKQSSTVRQSDHKGDRSSVTREPDFMPKSKHLARRPGPRKTPRYKFRDFAMI